MKKVVFAGIIVVVVLIFAVYLEFGIKGDTVNRIEREAFISRGSDRYEVTILNSNPVKVYQTESKVTSDVEKGYYFFWASVNGKKVYVQSPIMYTLIEEK